MNAAPSVRRPLAAIAVAMVATHLLPVRAAAQGDPLDALVAAFDSMARRDIWPGFRPDTIPLAIFDGTKTILVRHPTPPPEFSRVARRDVVAEMSGRYAAVTANSSADIGGRKTATLLPRFDRSTPREWAAVMIHEAFHVYQRSRHPTWTANEADLFTYPFENVDALAARRLEYAALRRALEARGDADAACWTRAALAEREKRFARLGEASATYERRGELNEGLARYVQYRAVGKTALADMSPEEFPPDLVRDRVYVSGAAMGQLLDRLRARWRRELELADSGASLDGTLARATTRASGACGLGDAERTEAARVAARDVAARSTKLAEDRARFEEAPGTSVEIDASRAALFVNGFDPLNVVRLSPSEILHRRYLALKNDRGELEVIDHAALTEGAGIHPLFAGVKLVRLTGLPQSLTVKERGGGVELTAEGLRLRFTGATLVREGTRVRVTLAATP